MSFRLLHIPTGTYWGVDICRWIRWRGLENRPTLVYDIIEQLGNNLNIHNGLFWFCRYPDDVKVFAEEFEIVEDFPDCN